MHRRIMTLCMGRAGSVAIPQWITANYPGANYRGGFLIEYENPLPEQPEILRVEAYFKHVRFPPLPQKDKIIVYGWRDPWNHFAALLQYWKTERYTKVAPPYKQTEKHHFFALNEYYIPNHKQVLKQALGKAAFLSPKEIFCNYNRWFGEEEYRKELANKLELPTHDKGFNHLWNFSSFQKEEDVTDISQLDVFNRWKHYVDDERYMQLFEDKELVDLASQFWPPPF